MLYFVSWPFEVSALEERIPICGVSLSRYYTLQYRWCCNITKVPCIHLSFTEGLLSGICRKIKVSMTSNWSCLSNIFLLLIKVRFSIRLCDAQRWRNSERCTDKQRWRCASSIELFWSQRSSQCRWRVLLLTIDLFLIEFICNQSTALVLFYNSTVTTGSIQVITIKKENRKGIFALVFFNTEMLFWVILID